VTISKREGSTNKYVDMCANSKLGHLKSGSDIERDDIPPLLKNFIDWCQLLKNKPAYLLVYGGQAQKLRKICKDVGQEVVLSEVGSLVNTSLFMNNILAKSIANERFEKVFPGSLFPQAMSEASLLIMKEVFKRKLSSLEEVNNYCSVNQRLQSELLHDSPISQPFSKTINGFEKTSDKDNIFH
jgi:hypothetical protein